MLNFGLVSQSRWICYLKQKLTCFAHQLQLNLLTLLDKLSVRCNLIHTQWHITRMKPLKYAVAWLLLSFLISCVIEWMLLSELLHGNDYFAGHLRPSSAWLNVMDGEEMVMSETLQVLPDPSHSIITVTQFVWAQLERVLPICLDAVKYVIPTTGLSVLENWVISCW